MKCNEHVPPKERDWYVPSIICPDTGTPWGYTSIPDAACQSFYALAEKDPAGHCWTQASADGWVEGWRAPAVAGKPG